MKKDVSTVLNTCLLPVLLLAGVTSVSGYDPYEGPLRLGSNENAYGLSKAAITAVIDRLDNGNYYNRDEVAKLEVAAAEKEKLTPDYILTTPGSGPILEMTAHMVAEPGKNLITADPGYPQLTRLFEALGGEIKYVPVGEDYGYDFDAIREAIDENTSIVYICNPNNPTGTLADAMELRQFIISVPKDVMVFVDEAYLELADEDFYANTMSPLVKLRENLIISRTFSKAYGLAGYRIGYGVMSPALKRKMDIYYQGSPTFLSALAATAALGDKQFIKESQQHYSKLRNKIKEQFRLWGVPHSNSQAAFVFFDSGMPNTEFVQKMLDEGIIIRAAFGPAKGFETWCRVSIGTEEEIDAFLAAASRYLISQPTG